MTWKAGSRATWRTVSSLSNAYRNRHRSPSAPARNMSEAPAALVGAIEAGGTKFLCAVARDVDTVLASERFATTTPLETLAQVLRFFDASQKRHGLIDAFGIASFGPLDLDPRSAGYGNILATPKAGWAGYDLTAQLRQRFAKPVFLDTDVNAAALAEWRQRDRDAIRSLVYVTVGTGIGGGAVLNGRTLKGLGHPEMGHIRVQRHAQDLQFPGVCAFHQDCLEGLANGPAIVARWGVPMSSLLADSNACSIIGSYLGQLAATITLMLSPHLIVFGGGVMSGAALLPYVRRSARQQLAGYLVHATLRGSLDDFITAPMLGERSGIAGAILLASSGLSAHA
jgi:fructokinase